MMRISMSRSTSMPASANRARRRRGGSLLTPGRRPRASTHPAAWRRARRHEWHATSGIGLYIAANREAIRLKSIRVDLLVLCHEMLALVAAEVTLARRRPTDEAHPRAAALVAC